MKYELSISRPDMLTQDQVKALTLCLDLDGSIMSEYNPDYVQKYVTIDTLEQLQSFIKQYGKVIVTENSIEIYNGYRE